MKTRKAKWFLVLCAALVCAAVVPLATWASTIQPSYGWYTANPEASVFTLADPSDFAGLANLVNGKADLDGDGSADDFALDFSEKTVRLSESFGGNFWYGSIDPIGGQGETVFNGIFDGNGKTLTNFSVDTTGISKNLGVFGHTGADSVIKNLVLGSGSSLTKTLSGSEPDAIENAGLLVGYSEGRIENCAASGSVTIRHGMNQTAETVYPVKNIGGLAGKVLGDIVYCKNMVNISVTETGFPYKAAEGEEWADTTVIVLNVGGVAGCAGSEDSSTGGGKDAIHGVVTGCENTGTIRVDTPNENGFDRFGNQLYANSSDVGGVLGYSRGSITESRNDGYVDAANGIAVGGITGGLRNSSEASNMSAAGMDDGTENDPLFVTECTNGGNVRGRAVVGGIAGRAGSYTTIRASINETNTFVVGERPNKPFPAGIVGVTYGEVAYCANFGTVASGIFDGTRVDTYLAGYYAAGIAGGTHYWTNSAGMRISPMPEVYGCYNAGYVLAVGNYRQRHIVGNNEGYCHDNIAEKGRSVLGGDKIVYGDEPGDSDATGTATGNYLITAAELKSNAVIDTATQATALSVLNLSGDKDGWTYFWTRPSGSINGGYPALNTQAFGNTDLSGAVVSHSANAQYTGLAAVPSASVSLGGVMLEQNIDFKVVPEADATEVTQAGQTPYTAHIVAIGSTYSGTAEQTLAYGIDAGSLSKCTVLIDPRPFNWEAQAPEAENVHVYNLAGGKIDPAEYSFVLDENDPDFSALEYGGRGAVNAKKYDVIVTAEESSVHFVGSTKGEFAITPVKILWSSDDDGDSKNAHPIELSYAGQAYPWQSTTIAPNAADEELVLKTEYTGHPVYPAVTKVTYLGRELVQGAIGQGGDYIVTYGETMEGASLLDNTGGKDGKGYGSITVRYLPGGNFSNQDNMMFLITDTEAKNDIKDAQIRGDEDVVFETGSIYTPIEVWYGGSKLDEGADYEIVYTGNDQLGTASYTVTGIGDNFTGTKSGTFRIVEGVSYALSYSYDEAAKTAALTGGDYYGQNQTFEIEIPQTVEKGGVTYTVTAIAGNAFGSQVSNEVKPAAAKLSKVTVPATVKSIGDNAFGAAAPGVQLKRLEMVVFAEGSQLESIGASAFRGCGLTELVIPARVSTLGDRAFQDCAALKKVTFLSGEAGRPNASAFSSAPLTTPFAGCVGVKAYGYDEATGIRSFVETYYMPHDTGLFLGWTWNSLGSTPETGVQTGLPGSGDYDGDGMVTGVDVNFVIRAATGQIALSPSQRDALDIDRDGLITAMDVTNILRMAIGLPPLNA